MVGNATFQRTQTIRSHQQLKRDRHSHTAIQIAQWNLHQAWITVGTKGSEEKIYLDEGIPYSIQIEIRNAIVIPIEATMNLCWINCDLLYGIGEDGNKTVSLKMTSRYPEYEGN